MPTCNTYNIVYEYCRYHWLLRKFCLLCNAATPGVPQQSQWISWATMWEALLSFRDHRSRSLLAKCNTAQQIPLGEGLCFSTFLGFSPQCHLTCCCKTSQLHVTARWMNIEKKMTNTQQPDHIWTVGRSYDSVTSWRPRKLCRLHTAPHKKHVN